MKKLLAVLVVSTLLLMSMAVNVLAYNDDDPLMIKKPTVTQRR